MVIVENKHHLILMNFTYFNCSIFRRKADPNFSEYNCYSFAVLVRIESSWDLPEVLTEHIWRRRVAKRLAYY